MDCDTSEQNICQPHTAASAKDFHHIAQTISHKPVTAMNVTRTFSACLIALLGICDGKSTALSSFQTPPSNQIIFRRLTHCLGRPLSIKDARLPDKYGGPLLAGIDSSSWVLVKQLAPVRSELIELYDPHAGGWITVRREQFLKRWQGRGIIFPSTVVTTAQDSAPEGTDRAEPQPADASAQAPPPTGITCLCLAFRHFGLDMREKRLMHEHALDSTEPAMVSLAEIAHANGFKTRKVRLDWDKAVGLGAAFPAIARCRDGTWCLLCTIDMAPDGGMRLQVLRPETGEAPLQSLDQEGFAHLCTGDVLLLKKKYSLGDDARPFGLAWFVPEFLRQKSIFINAALAMFLIMGISLIIPIFFQLVIDKVLPHHTYNSLNVLAGGVLIAITYNAALEFLKSYLLFFATNKIDINLSMKTFSHLMRLPVGFFETIPAGLVLKHMQQTEKIRGFLSGNLFFAFTDVLSLMVFIPVLMLYSVRLTAIVLAFSLLMMFMVLVLVKPFQKRLDQLYRIEGQRQSRLVESIYGIRSVKSLAIEPHGEKEWNDISANAINSHFNVGKISFTAKTLSQFLEMSLSVAIVWYGAHLVFDMTITIGALVAFQMISGRVSAPLVKLVSLVHEYQQVALSVKMLGVVMNTRQERAGGNLHTDIDGTIDFHEVTFRYKPDMQPAIDNLSLHVKKGEILGIAGRSGSGKSTLARLLQALYLPQQGFIRVDGTDIRELEKMHLRRNVGVVLQDNYFFRGSIRDNIRIARPDASAAEIMRVSMMAGAHSFVSQLRAGYDTMLEENAVNLSGGQKQRLAIARVLLTDPAILILDEATSALDPESEWEIQKNIGQIAQGKTVIIISHRLSFMRQTHRVVVIDRGRIIDSGSHEELVTRSGLYQTFWRQQMGGHDV
ncbi:peptidase domain-containing ABC transporter [uncultured Desulfovibrio sp.]|uniref:peptidase domain-containing ABC transporter n=3 Tax=uncultured Desulfovibrio sp. TaxID=167968 RepID=UPI00260FF2E4|nr:peptidase domain-containing ABC transporter [uncultured Desulfovibrio sp.]